MSHAPDFAASAIVDNEIDTVKLSDYKGKSLAAMDVIQSVTDCCRWVILFFWPKDFTFVCPTEIIAFSDRAKEFEKLGCQLLGGSTDTEETHLAWIKTPRKKGGLGNIKIPLIADTTKEIAAKYGVLKKDLGVALRGLFVINPDGDIEHITINNLGIGRNVDEALRLLQAAQFVREHGEVCPADWKPGEQSLNPAESDKYFESAKASQDVEETNLKVLTDKKDFEALMQKPGKVVVDYMASWCGKCKMIKPTVEKLQDKYPDITFAHCGKLWPILDIGRPAATYWLLFGTDEEKLEGLAADLGIKTLPAFRFYKDGKDAGIKEIVGYKKKPLTDAVEEFVKQ
eukprot:jgi/Astpho2/3401/Aster-04735